MARIEAIHDGSPDLAEAAANDTVRSFRKALRRQDQGLQELQDGLKPKAA